jgi:DNA recombination protein RmuC
MFGAIAAAIAGLIIGFLVANVRSSARLSAQWAELATLTAERDAASASATTATEQLERERLQHADAMKNMRDAFQVAATEALGTVVAQQSEQQEAVLKQREAKLDDRLRPLSDALLQYREQVEKMNVDRATSFESLSKTTSRLMELQDRSISETERLNRILGREKDRGSWGENQLENIFRLSGMEPYIDYMTQLTVSQDAKNVRPDAVVRLPGRGNFAIDSKAPLADYDTYLTAETPEQQAEAAKVFAATVKRHIQQLTTKSYYDYIKPSPDFVACFIPSDNVLSTALSGDQDLWNFAVRSKVLLCGPSSLMGMLWSVAYGWRQSQLQENAQEIMDLSETLHQRISVAYGHFHELSRSLGTTVKSYNKLVDSMESRLLVTIRTMETKGVKSKADIKEVDALVELPHDPNPDKWPVVTALPLATLEAEIVDSSHEAE